MSRAEALIEMARTPAHEALPEVRSAIAAALSFGENVAWLRESKKAKRMAMA
jgi:epoxyqueuosine reductase QueG